MASCQTLINIILQTDENNGGRRSPLHTIAPRVIPVNVLSIERLGVCLLQMLEQHKS